MLACHCQLCNNGELVNFICTCDISSSGRSIGGIERENEDWRVRISCGDERELSISELSI